MWFLSYLVISNDEVGWLALIRVPEFRNVTLGQGDLWVLEVAVWPLVIQDQRRVNPENPGQALPLEYIPWNIRANSSIEKTALLCNDDSHWVGAELESALNMHTVSAWLCLVAYSSRLLHWHWGNLMVAPVPGEQPWRIWVNVSCKSTKTLLLLQWNQAQQRVRILSDKL